MLGRSPHAWSQSLDIYLLNGICYLDGTSKSPAQHGIGFFCVAGQVDNDVSRLDIA
jgi:hypothetical protein